MQPPVSLLLYADEEPGRAVFYPFAEFSPEWQALRFGLQHKIETRFCDLPQGNQLAMRMPMLADKSSSLDTDDAGTETTDDKTTGHEATRVAPDPLTQLGRAAGYEDGEQWWEHLVEHRRNSLEVFDAIREAMAAVRESGKSVITQPKTRNWNRREKPTCGKSFAPRKKRALPRSQWCAGRGTRPR